MLTLLTLLAVAHAGPEDERLLTLLTEAHGLDEAERAAVAEVLAASDRIHTGDPKITKHPMDRATCEKRRSEAGLSLEPDPEAAAICGRPWMSPLYDPATEKATDATTCIDQYEFPDVPCEYPVIWVRASEAAGICEAMGKRLCDAHEWEGACAGSLGGPDQDFSLAVGKSPEAGQKAMRLAHNAAAEQAWAYGPAYEKGVCAAASTKNAACDGSNANACGSNTYPTGAFPGCVSKLGVYDLHGNAAEHMNLALSEDQLSRPGGPLGVTEMKGSWFIWDSYRAHEDWCRWRAPYWHGGPVRAADSHRNYHLSFRCCADVSR